MEVTVGGVRWQGLPHRGGGDGRGTLADDGSGGRKPDVSVATSSGGCSDIGVGRGVVGVRHTGRLGGCGGRRRPHSASRGQVGRRWWLGVWHVRRRFRVGVNVGVGGDGVGTTRGCWRGLGRPIYRGPLAGNVSSTSVGLTSARHLHSNRWVCSCHGPHSRLSGRGRGCRFGTRSVCGC